MEIDYDYLRTGTAIGFHASRELCSNYLLPPPRRLCFARVCLSVCVLARWLKKLWKDLSEILRECREWQKLQVVQFWGWSGGAWRRSALSECFSSFLFAIWIHSSPNL